MVKPWLGFADLDTPTDPYAEYAINAASFILWSLSGRKYNGVSSITEQYVCPGYDLPLGCSWETKREFSSATGVSGYVLPHHLYSFSSDYGLRFRLRQGPVRAIDSVVVDGEELPPDSYRVRNNAEAVIYGGFGMCSGPEITYRYGVHPPDAGKLAAIELANELILGYNGDSSCSLPSRVTSIQRQGISIEVYDPAEFLDRGRLGLFSADMFLAAVNPNRHQKPAKIFSPDSPKGYKLR